MKVEKLNSVDFKCLYLKKTVALDARSKVRELPLRAESLYSLVVWDLFAFPNSVVCS